MDMDHILRDVGLDHLIPVFQQQRYSVNTFKYLFQSANSKQSQKMVMENANISVGELISIWQRIEETTIQQPLQHKSHSPIPQQQRQVYPKSHNLTSSYGRSSRISKLVGKPAQRSFNSINQMMSNNKAHHGSNLDNFLGIKNQSANSLRRDSSTQKQREMGHGQQSVQIIQHQPQMVVEQPSEQQSVQIQEVIKPLDKQVQIIDHPKVDERLEDNHTEQEEDNEGEDAQEIMITETEKQDLQIKASQDYVFEKLNKLSQQQDEHSSDEDNYEKQFVPRKISSPRSYEQSNFSDHFQKPAKQIQGKDFENIAANPMPQDAPEAFDVEASVEEESVKESKDEYIEEAEKMMINAEKAAQEDNDDQDSYSEEVDDKDTGKKFENEIKNQLPFKMSEDEQPNQTQAPQTIEVEDSSEVEEDDDDSNSQIQSEQNHEQQYKPSGAFNNIRKPQPQYSQSNGAQIHRPIPQIPQQVQQPTQHLSRPTIGLKQPCTPQYMNQIQQRDYLGQLQQQLQQQLEMKQRITQENIKNAEMSDEEESSLESVVEEKIDKVEQKEQQKQEQPQVDHDDSESYDDEEDMEQVEQVQNQHQDKQSDVQEVDVEDKDDEDDDLPSDSEFNKEAMKRKEDAAKIAKQSYWKTGNIPAQQDQFRPSAAQEYNDDSQISEENFAQQIHAENNQASKESDDIAQKFQDGTQNTNTFMAGISESQNQFYPPADVIKPQMIQPIAQKQDSVIITDQDSSSFAVQQEQSSQNLKLIQMQNTLTSQNSVGQSGLNYQNQQASIVSPQKVIQTINQQSQGSNNQIRHPEARQNILSSEPNQKSFASNNMQDKCSILQNNDDCDPHQQIMSEIKQSQHYQEFQAPQQFTTNLQNQIASSYNSSSGVKMQVAPSQHLENASSHSNIMKYDQYAQIDIKPRVQDMQIQNDLLTPDNFNNLKNKIRSELRNEVQDEVRAELHNQVEREVMAKVRQQVEYEITSQVTEKVTQSVKMQVEQEKQQQLQNQIQAIQIRIKEEERIKFESEKSEQLKQINEYKSNLQSEQAKFQQIIIQKENEIQSFRNQEQTNQNLVYQLNHQLNQLKEEKTIADQNVQNLQIELEREKQAKQFEAQQQAHFAQMKKDEEERQMAEQVRLQQEAEQQQRQAEQQRQHLEMQRQAEILSESNQVLRQQQAEIQRQEAEASKQRQEEELQRQRQEAEIQRQREDELQRQRQEAELQMQKELEDQERRRQQFEQQQQQEALKKKEEEIRQQEEYRQQMIEQQRQAEADARKQQEEQQERQKELLRQQAAREEAIRQEKARQEAIVAAADLQRQKEQQEMLLRRKQEEEAAMAALAQRKHEQEEAERRLAQEQAQRRAAQEEQERQEAERQEHQKQEAEIRFQTQKLEEAKRVAEEQLKQIEAQKKQQEQMEALQQQKEKMELLQKQMLLQQQAMRLQFQKDQAEQKQKLEEEERQKQMMIILAEQQKKAEEQVAELEKQRQIQEELREKQRLLEQEVIERKRLEGLMLLEKKRQQELQAAELKRKEMEELDKLKELQMKQEQLKKLIDEKNKREEGEEIQKALIIQQSAEKSQSQDTITHTSMIKAQKEMILDLEQKKQKLERENQQMQQKIQASSQMSQISAQKSLGSHHEGLSGPKEINIINLDEDTLIDTSPSKQKYLQQLREESSFLPDQVKIKKEKKKIIKRVRFYDDDEPADRSSFTDDQEEDDDSDYEQIVHQKKRRIAERIETPEVEVPDDQNIEDECDQEFARFEQKQLRRNQRLRNAELSSDQEKKDTSFASETNNRRKLNKKFSEDDSATLTDKALKKLPKRKQKVVRKSTGTSKSTSPAPELLANTTSAQTSQPQFESWLPGPKTSKKKGNQNSDQKNYCTKVLQHVEKTATTSVKQNKNLMEMLRKIAVKK